MISPELLYDGKRYIFDPKLKGNATASCTGWYYRDDDCTTIFVWRLSGGHVNLNALYSRDKFLEVEIVNPRFRQRQDGKYLTYKSLRMAGLNDEIRRDTILARTYMPSIINAMREVLR